MKQVKKPERYLGPKYRMQAARDAAAATERLARKAAAKKASPQRRIKVRTPERAKDEATYRKEVKAWLALPENHWCKFQGCTRPSTEVHHSRGKRGRLLNHKPFWIGLCHQHHEWVTNHTEEARQFRLIGPVGSWNNQKQVDTQPACV